MGLWFPLTPGFGKGTPLKAQCVRMWVGDASPDSLISSSALTIPGRTDVAYLEQITISCQKPRRGAYAGSPDLLQSLHLFRGVAQGFKNKFLADIQARNFDIRTRNIQSLVPLEELDSRATLNLCSP